MVRRKPTISSKLYKKRKMVTGAFGHLELQQKASEMTNKKRKRLENKKRKLKAYLDLAESNIEDRMNKMKGTSQGAEEEGSNMVQDIISDAKEIEKVEPPQQVKRKLTAEEFAEYKKRKKELDKQKMSWPRMFLNNLGECGSLTVDASQRSPLFMTDMQSVLLNSLPGLQFGRQPRWMRMVRFHKFSHTVTVLVEGVSLGDILDATQVEPQDATQVPQDTLSDTTSQVSSKLENKSIEKKKGRDSGENDDGSSGIKENMSRGQGEGRCSQPEWLSDVLPLTSRSTHFKVELMAPAKYKVAANEELVKIALSNEKRMMKDAGWNIETIKRSGLELTPHGTSYPRANDNKQKKAKASTGDTKLPDSDQFDRRLLLLSMEDLCAFNFPMDMPGCLGHDNPEFTFTSDQYTEVTPSSPMFAVDCEMCMTDIRQLELTSISIVNEKLELIYHTLVIPENSIINYLTRFSGITEKLLADVTTRLSDVQEHLKQLLPPDAILVGHSLDSDLKAMKMMHPYVIDSSLIYNLSYCRHKRSSLKMLTKEFLGIEIQNHGASGHDPTEDASASLKLVQLKLKHDTKFGDVIQGGAYDDWTKVEKEDDHNYKNDAEYLTEACKDATSLFEHGSSMSMAFLTTPSCMENYSSIMESISEKVSYVEVLPGNKQVSQRAAEVAIHKNFTFIHMRMDVRLGTCQSREDRRHHLKKLDKRLDRIMQGAAIRALVMFVFSGSSLATPKEQLNNGFAMIGIKGLPYKNV